MSTKNTKITKDDVKKSKRLWNGVNENDFYNENDNIIDEDLAKYNLDAMILFSQNTNLFRHLVRLSDSLKPVERRIMFTLYEDKALPDSKNRKSSRIVGDTMAMHAHGDASIYKTVVGLSQPWKNPCVLIKGTGNFGNDTDSNDYAHMRYTEAKMSKYGYECFFKDYDPDCIETIFNTALDGEEPMSLPSRWPNILINGGFGIAVGNSFCIPTYNIYDIITLCKRLLHNPENPDIYISPDSPTGCDIVDNGLLREICDTGKGIYKMRAIIDICTHPKKPNVWILKIKNLPWMVSLSNIKDRLTQLTKDGILPIKDIQDHSYAIKTNDKNGITDRLMVDCHIYINKAHDPNIIKEKLYSLTELQKSLSVNFKVVEDGLSVGKMNMRDLVLAWIDTRKEYKRRLMNKKIVKINARISLLNILITLLEKDNIEKTMKIIRTNNSSEIISALMKHAEMSSYQAEKIAEMRLSAFTKDARDKYVEERIRLKNELERILKMVNSPKKINAEIEEELDDLIKYAQSRKSKIIAELSKVEVANTDHFVTITKRGMIKKLPYSDMSIKKTPALGAFKPNDYPTHGIVMNNHDSIMLFDHLGRFSCVPLHEIENTESSQYGVSVYDSCKLNGEIVSAFSFFPEDTQDYIKKNLNSQVSIVTLTKNGYLKKTSINEFTKSRNQKNMRSTKIRDDDQLVFSKIIMDSKNKPVDLLIYTEKGQYVYVASTDIAEQSKDSMGLLSIKLGIDDACIGMCVIGKKDEYLAVVTSKGNVKLCDLGYLGTPGKRKLSSYLTTVEENDKVIFVDAVNEKQIMNICTRTSYTSLAILDIPVKSRKAKCVKMVPVPLGNNIIAVDIK